MCQRHKQVKMYEQKGDRVKKGTSTKKNAVSDRENIYN